ncbi:MAG: glycosyltransferase family 4 protein [Candidatus Blackburnbacteria bacterium]|nr:glycosyltransferase family 4 protein [Candidatus Blackburnbacteria bacterium]
MEKKKLKIAFLSFYSGEVYRGVETFVHEVANRLSAFGHTVIVLQNGSAAPGSLYKTVSLGLPLDLKRKPQCTSFVFNYYAFCVRQFTQEALRLVEEDVDILFPINGQWQSLLCRLWSWKRGTRMVLVGQSGLGIDDRLNLWTFPNVFVGLTRFQIQWSKRVNPFVRVVTIPNGVDLAKFKPRAKAIKIELPKPVILSVAALTSWKRLDLAMKAVASLKQGSLLLVGQGEDREKLQKLGDDLLPGRFQISSFPYQQMPGVYASADLFTFPTVPWESFGIAMVEAMATNLPVVASDDPIRREIVGNAGLFVDPLDTSAYANVLKEALDTNWGNKPREQAKKFSWDEIAKSYDRLFRNLV